MHGATNTIGIVFVPRFFIEDRNGAALTVEGGFAYQQVMIKDANGKEVLTHAPIPFNPHNPKFLCFTRFKAALRWLRTHSIPGKPEIKDTKMMKHFRNPPPKPESIPAPMKEHGFFCVDIPWRFRSTPEMYRRRGMKGHALFLAYGGENFRAMRERQRTAGNIAALLPVVRRKRFNADWDAEVAA